MIAVFRPARAHDADAVLRCVRILRAVQAGIERRDCGTGAGGFKPGNKCAGGGDGGGTDGGDSGGGAPSSVSMDLSSPEARQIARDFGVDPTEPRLVEAAVRMRGVIDTADPLRSSMVRQMADMPGEHAQGLKKISSLPQGTEAVSSVRTANGIEEVTILGAYRPLAHEIRLSGHDNIQVIGGGTLHHEVGHHVHEHLLTNDGDSEWRSISGNGENARISAYARTSRGEHFAEAYGHYARGGTYRSKLKSAEPKVYAFMQKVFRKKSKLIDPKGLNGYSSTRWGDR